MEIKKYHIPSIAKVAIEAENMLSGVKFNKVYVQLNIIPPIQVHEI